MTAPACRLPSLTSSDPVLERAVDYTALCLRTYGEELRPGVWRVRLRADVAALSEAEPGEPTVLSPRRCSTTGCGDAAVDSGLCGRCRAR